jgi:hypothetical protein
MANTSIIRARRKHAKKNTPIGNAINATKRMQRKKYRVRKAKSVKA